MIQIYKFGGASIKDANAVKNMANIIKNYKHNNLVVVVSAMGKTTNNLENLFNAAFANNPTAEFLNTVISYHQEIIDSLFENKNEVQSEFNKLISKLKTDLKKVKNSKDYDEGYDSIISYGEIISTTIIYHYLIEIGLKTRFIHAYNYIQTDNTWREGKVDWKWTQQNIQNHLMPLVKKETIITQGFIGGTPEGKITTLGREGSDYTASIFAYCLNAESVTIWKDVEGVLNADPKVFEKTVKYDELSYNEAIEMTYYGATVIHPKTIKPIATKEIPLYVKSFICPEKLGTSIKNSIHKKTAPAFIKKPNQVLISISVKDFSFVTENNLSNIFMALATLNVKINLMQNSALSFSICIDENNKKMEKLINTLQAEYKIQYNANLTLYTIKNYTSDSIANIIKDKNIMVEQKTRNTYQVLVSE